MPLINKNGLVEREVLKGTTKFLIFDPNSNQKNAGQEVITWDNIKAEIDSEITGVDAGFSIGGTLTVDTINENTANTGVTIETTLLKNGGVSNGAETIFAGFFPLAAQNNIAAAAGGAIPVTNYLTTINTEAGGDAFTLADGSQIGQLKRILLVVDGGGDAVITPANLNAGTTITMGDAGDAVILIWNGSEWYVIDNLGSTIA
jgi:hypothetical protein